MVTRYKTRSILQNISSGLLLLGLAGCGGSKDEEDPPVAGTCETSQQAMTAPTLSELYSKVIEPQCAPCHGGTVDVNGTGGGPSMQSAALFYSQVVGKKGSDYQSWATFQGNRAACNNISFIAAGNPNQSMVVGVLDPTVDVGCTLKIHRNQAPQNVCITDGNLQKLKEWISAGAPQ